MNRRAGFTLLEVLLALSLMVMTLSAVLIFYGEMLGARRQGTQMAQSAQLDRVILAQLTREIRQARRIQEFRRLDEEGEKGLGGKLLGIELWTYEVPSREHMKERPISESNVPAEYDLRHVQYYLIRADNLEDDDGNPRVFGLARKENKLRNRPVVVEGEEGDDPVELIAPEIKYLEFRYFDGAQWTSRWENADNASLPQAVRVTIGRKPVPEDDETLDEGLPDEDRFARIDEVVHPDRVTTVVPVMMADPVGGASRAQTLRRQVNALGGGATK